MRSAGITLILAGIALIGAIGFDVMKKERTTSFTTVGVTKKEIAPVRWFTALGTMLIITGVSVAVVGKKDGNRF